MERRVEDERVTFEVAEPISIGFGITLKPGVYVGRRGRSWRGAVYWVELTRDELQSLGGMGTPGTESTVYDITTFVRSGKIDVFG